MSAFFEENSVTYSNGKVITTFRDNFSFLCTLEDPGAVSRVGKTAAKVFRNGRENPCDATPNDQFHESFVECFLWLGSKNIFVSNRRPVSIALLSRSSLNIRRTVRSCWRAFETGHRHDDFFKISLYVPIKTMKTVAHKSCAWLVMPSRHTS